MNRTDRTGNSDIIVERIAVAAGDADFALWYAETRLPQIMRLGGVREGVFSRVAAEQMLKPQPDSHYIALYRTGDLSKTLRGWTAGGLGQGAWRTGTVLRGCYTPLIPRLTAHAVCHPAQAEADRAAAARASLGEVYHGFPEEMLDEIVR